MDTKQRGRGRGLSLHYRGASILERRFTVESHSWKAFCDLSNHQTTAHSILRRFGRTRILESLCENEARNSAVGCIIRTWPCHILLTIWIHQKPHLSPPPPPSPTSLNSGTKFRLGNTDFILCRAHSYWSFITFGRLPKMFRGGRLFKWWLEVSPTWLMVRMQDLGVESGVYELRGWEGRREGARGWGCCSWVEECDTYISTRAAV